VPSFPDPPTQGCPPPPSAPLSEEEQAAAARQLDGLREQQPEPGRQALTNTVVWSAVLGPAPPGLERAVPLMEEVVKKERNSLYLNRLGALLVRVGRHKAGIARLREAVALRGDGGTAWDWLFLARAHHALGQAAEARAALARARDWVRRQAAGQVRDERFRGPLGWTDRAELHVLFAEVEALPGLR